MTARKLKSAIVALLFMPFVASAGESAPQSWELADEAHAFFTAEALAAAGTGEDACIDAVASRNEPATGAILLATANDACIDAAATAHEVAAPDLLATATADACIDGSAAYERLLQTARIE